MYWDARDATSTIAPPRIAAGPPTSAGEMLQAGWRAGRDAYSSISREMLMAEQHARRAEIFQEITGQSLGPNPYNLRPREIMLGRFTDERAAAIEEQEERIREARRNLPPADAMRLETLDRLEDRAGARARGSEERFDDLSSRSGWQAFGAGMAGQMGAALADPPIAASLILGAPAASGVLRTAILEGLVAAGSEAAVQPNIQRWRDEIGLDAGLSEALTQVAITGGAGFIFGGAVRGAQRMLLGQGERGTRELAGDVADQPPEVRAAAEELDEAQMVRDADPFDPASEIGQQEHIARLTVAEQGLRNGEIVDQGEPVALLAPVAMRAPDGIPRFDPANIEIDAQRFQFKSGGDEMGATDRLAGVTQWDPIRAGVGIVWEQADGRLFVADGHQRLNLAKRLQREGQDVAFDAHVLRERDGVTAEQARATAAATNIAQDSGTAVDAAIVFREADPSLLDNLPPRSALVRQAQGLARLDRDSFDLIVNEVIPANYGAIVGDLVDDPAMQKAIIGLLSRAQPMNANQAELMVRDALAAGATRETQFSLFGEEEVANLLIRERAGVRDRAMKQIMRDKALFRTLVDQEGRIADAGNVLDADANLQRVNDSARVLQAVHSLADRRGPVADALNAAARRAQSDDRYDAAVGDFIDAIRGAVARGDIDGLRSGGAGRAEETPAATPRTEDRQTAGIERQRVADRPEVDEQTAELAQLERDIDGDLAEFDWDVPIGQRVDGDTPVAEAASARTIRQDLTDDGEFQQTLGVCAA